MNVSTLCSLIIAFVALWIAWDSRRKTTQHILKIHDIKNGWIRSIGKPDFQYLNIYIKNLGLPLGEMSLNIQFLLPTNGSAKLSLRNINIRTEVSDFIARDVKQGSITQFSWRTFELDKREFELISDIKSIYKQKLRINIYNNGYFVKSLSCFSIKNKLKERFQTVVIFFYNKLKLSIFAIDQKSFRARLKMPNINKINFCINNFIIDIRSEIDKGNNSAH